MRGATQSKSNLFRITRIWIIFEWFMKFRKLALSPSYLMRRCPHAFRRLLPFVLCQIWTSIGFWPCLISAIKFNHQRNEKYLLTCAFASLCSVFYDKSFEFFKVEEWERRAADYRKICQDIVDMFNRVSHAPNKPLVQELYPYILDVKDVSMLLDAFVKWLGNKISSSTIFIAKFNGLS